MATMQSSDEEQKIILPYWSVSKISKGTVGQNSAQEEIDEKGQLPHNPKEGTAIKKNSGQGNMTHKTISQKWRIHKNTSRVYAWSRQLLFIFKLVSVIPETASEYIHIQIN